MAAEKRSLFKMIFGGVEKLQKAFTMLQVLTGFSATFTPWGNNPYDADTVRQAVDAIARNAAKLKPKHIRRVGKDIAPMYSQIERVLQIRPNPVMSAYDFYYKMITTLYIDNNAFAYPVWEGSKLVAIWPLTFSNAEFWEDDSKELYMKFYFATGSSVVLPYDEVIHLRRHFYNNDVLGSTNTAADGTLEAVHTANEGIAQAIKSSANLRGILKYQGMLKDTDITSSRTRFVDEFLGVSNSGGVAAIDSKADFVELKGDPKIINAAQMKELRDSVYRYYGINENVVKSDLTDDQWGAFYESVLEPLAVQMSLEFTWKLFTGQEQARGNEIVFEANRLQYVNVKTKTQMIKDLAPLGLFTINEAREVFNMAPVEGGDKRIQTLNVVSADKADQYQLGEGGGDDKDKGDETDTDNKRAKAG